MITQPIVVGVDGSPESVAAASAAWMMAELAGVPCRLVHPVNDVSADLLNNLPCAVLIVPVRKPERVTAPAPRELATAG